MPPPDTTTPGAIKQRRYRDRRKKGKMVIPLEVGWDDLDCLESAGLIGPYETNKGAINGAVRKALDEWKNGNIKRYG